ncbi:hypothetical protein ACU635_06785 [[Actinomadura] parvosata]|uniref:hypothetical protein n=1 Tax=[Actinomadura] parvosata TaxID=1955412 RepID=UPI00406BE25D
MGERCRTEQRVRGGTPAATDSQETVLKFAQCMRDNGVAAYPDPEGGMMRITQEAAEDPDLKSAEEKCKKAGPGGP